MKLSMDTVIDSLHDSSGYYLREKDNDQCLYSGSRIFRKEIDLSSDWIYIIEANHLMQLTKDQDLSFICVGNLKINIVNDKWNVFVLPEQEDIVFIYESVQNVFNKYNNWIEEINQLIFNKKSLQDIFNKACQHLKNPVALFDNCQGLLMTSGQIFSNKLDSVWSFVMEKGYAFKEPVDTLIKSKLYKKKKPFFYNSPDRHQNINRLIAPVFIEDRFFGVLAMTDLNASFSKAEYDNFRIVQEIMQNAIKFGEDYIVNMDTPWFLHRLVVGKSIDKTIVSYHLGIMGRKTDENFFLWSLSMKNYDHSGDVKIHDYLNHIAGIFQNGIVFHYENTILICDYDLSHYEDAEFFKTIEDFITRTNIKASISLIFNNIFELFYAYKQCQIADEFGENEKYKVNRFTDRYMDYILSIIEKNVRLDVIVFSNIRQINPMNDNGVELLNTLRTHITTGRNFSATAKELNIHRHTVVYRLKKIENLTNIDLDNADGDRLFQYYLSCEILLRNSNKDRKGNA
ncbi:MAG TPA: hypothetical protein DHN33_06175 [Eubacteriaceae bacterium]|nr:hypothetical protein [Eubacteriaceae bacterium]